MLGGAHLEWADLIDAHLEAASLRDANLEGAFLSRADLKEANLVGANLRPSPFQVAAGPEPAAAAADRSPTIVTREQLNEAKIDATTTLPEHLRDLTGCVAGSAQ